jgi:hypothetical protein
VTPTRPRVTGDDTLAPPTWRWMVTYADHVYPFASWSSAVTAALDPARLCRYACIRPGHGYGHRPQGRP